MTLKELYENVLIEIDKVKAPYLYVEDFNMYANKAQNNYTNKRYNLFEQNQQLSDDLQSLKGIYLVRPNSTLTTATVEIEGTPSTPIPIEKVQEGTAVTAIRFKLPENYRHLLKCTIKYSVNANYKCYTPSRTTSFTAKRLVDNQNIENNLHFRATYRQCYYYFYNNVNSVAPTIEVITGNIRPNFNYDTIDIRYIKDPQRLLLTQEQLDGTNDTSQLLEFPEYVCQEIQKELISLVLERASDPRLQTNNPVNTSIPDNYNQQ
jgi:hypothetical protein